MYAGIASGSNSAHSKVRRPGKSHAATSHAVVAPKVTTPTMTPKPSNDVSTNAAGITVASKWRSVSADSAVCQKLANTLSTGNATTAAHTIASERARPTPGSARASPRSDRGRTTPWLRAGKLTLKTSPNANENYCIYLRLDKC